MRPPKESASVNAVAKNAPAKNASTWFDRRELMKVSLGATAFGAFIGGVGWSAPAAAQWSGGGIRSVSHSLLEAPKYPDDFTHFGYANPDAPKGGVARLSTTGQYDSFNRYNAKGSPAAIVVLVNETLMTASLDEGSTHYGLLAEWMEEAPDGTWAAFRLRDEARWHDDAPVTVEDVRYSFELLTTKGGPLYQFYYGDVTEVVDEGDRIVRFKFKDGGNKELSHILGQVTVFPKHWWESRAFDEASLERPLGSGPYRVGEFEAGRFVELDRVENYWGADLPVNRGAYNFGKLRMEYFLDRDVEFEAFKRGETEYWLENSAKRWVERFDFPAFKQGKVIKRDVIQEGPKQLQGFAFNSRRPNLSDARVREAFTLAFDFEWTNRSVFFDQYARPSSYFQGSSELMASAPPDAAELALLEPYRDQLPAELFEKPFENPTTDGSGRNRRNLRKARKLLEEAGFTARGGKLRNAAGEMVTIEFLLGSSSQEAVVAPYLKNLSLLGVETRSRFVDRAQYVRRRNTYDFDMVISAWANTESPGNEQREYWGSAAAGKEGGRNLVGAQDPIIDELIEKIIVAEDRAALETASRALDRVLVWRHYAVFELYTPTERIAYWDKFGAPDPLPSRQIGFVTNWWVDPEKAAKL